MSETTRDLQKYFVSASVQTFEGIRLVMEAQYDNCANVQDWDVFLTTYLNGQPEHPNDGGMVGMMTAFKPYYDDNEIGIVKHNGLVSHLKQGDWNRLGIH
jgi:hypothetical protein